MPMSSTRLEVWGDPIAHSMSPALHRAAYAHLGLDWSYERRQVPAGRFAAEAESLDASFRGISITMPLKEEAFRFAESHDRHAALTAAVNTLLPTERQGFNTDVGGLIEAFRENAVEQIATARILGSGATAGSALVALAELGAERIEVRARVIERAAGLMALGERLGVAMSAAPFDLAAEPVDATVATLPSGTALEERIADRLAEHGGVLLDAAYAPWPSALAARWNALPVISGLAMLLHQAVRQVRIYVHGDPEHTLADESSLIDIMRAALMGD